MICTYLDLLYFAYTNYFSIHIPRFLLPAQDELKLAIKQGNTLLSCIKDQASKTESHILNPDEVENQTTVERFVKRFCRTQKVTQLIDHSQNPPTLSYCCHDRQTMPLSHNTSCSHAVKNTSQSKDETDNTPTEKTEQVTSDMKQGLRTLSF